MTTKYGLLGHPLGHSFSKKFHNGRFADLGIDAVYENFDLADINEIVDVLKQETTLKGLNVTIPYKQEIMRFLDELDPVAAKIGAVNTVKISRLSKDNALFGKTKIEGLFLKGFNTDIIGFTESIKPMLKPHHKRALILGTGGASRAIKVGLENLNIETAFVSRTPYDKKSPSGDETKRVLEMKSPSGEDSSNVYFVQSPSGEETKRVSEMKYPSGEDSSKSYSERFTYGDLNAEILAEFSVIVNCTPLGMFPNVLTCPDIPYEFLTEKYICFDAVYNPEETLFMKKAKERGASVKCGYEMLVGQAIASYDIWTRQ